MSTLRIGLAQWNLIWEDPSANILKISQLLTHTEPLDILVLPEMWSTGFTMNPQTGAENLDGPGISWMQETSATLNIHIAGSISVREGNHFYNRFFCFSPNGEEVYYDKKHLFKPTGEHEQYTPGQARRVFKIKDWKIFPIICYDLRFPVWCRNTDEYDVMMVVANWPSARIQHWDALLLARAIENQSYVVAVNRIGEDTNGLMYPGHSQAIGMDGVRLHKMDQQEHIDVITLDKSALNAYRTRFPFLADRDDFMRN